MPEKANKTTAESKSPQKKALEKSGVNHLAAKGKIDRALYMEWLSIPNMVKMLPEAELKKMGYNTDDVVFLKLIGCKTKGEFCKTFGIGANQPSRWESDPLFDEEMNKLTRKNHVMNFRKEVDFAFTQKVLRHGDAHRMKLWKQLYEGWNERTENVNVNVSMTPADLVREIEERNAKIRGEV